MNRLNALIICIPNNEALSREDATDLASYAAICAAERVSYVPELDKANVIFFSNDRADTQVHGKRILQWWLDGKIEILGGMTDYAIELPVGQIPEGYFPYLSNDATKGLVKLNHNSIEDFRNMMVMEGDGLNIFANAKYFAKIGSDEYVREPVYTEDIPIEPQEEPQP